MNDTTQIENALVRNESTVPAAAAATGVAKRKKSRLRSTMPMLATVLTLPSAKVSNSTTPLTSTSR
jgi:hypothetical protein